LYHVILLNDEDHTYDYVIEMLCKIFGFAGIEGAVTCIEVDTRGTTILLTCELEKASRNEIRFTATARIRGLPARWAPWPRLSNPPRVG